MFRGEYGHSIDIKGRVTIPAKFREKLGEECIVARGFEGCLYIYSNEEWDKAMGYLSSDDKMDYDPEVRQLQRVLMAQSIDCTYDKQGRILISNELRAKAHLEKDVVLVGVGRRIELWAKELWDASNDIDDEALAKLALSVSKKYTN